MRKAEIFKKAHIKYKELIEVCDEFYQSIIKKHYTNIECDSLLAQLDIYLQAILISVAASDKKFDSSELVFIEQLTEYGNIFDKIDGGIKAFVNADEKQIMILQELVKKHVEDIPLILKIIAKLDIKIKDTNYAELIIKRFFAIITCLVVIDDGLNINESKVGVGLIAPLIDLFPKVNVQQFFKK